MKHLKNLLWLYKPYWRYGKFFVLMSLFFWVAVVPLCRILLVIFPEMMVEALDAGWPMTKIAVLVIGFQAAMAAIPIFEDFYIQMVKAKAETKVELKIKRDVYEQALRTDYRYIDNPDYYNKYMWAIDHQAEKAGEAFNMINNGLSALMVITALVSIIATFNPIIVLLTVLSMVLRTYGYMKYSKVEVARENEMIPCQRKLSYFHRIFYLREHSADLKSTALREYLLKHYDEETESKIGIIKKYAVKLIIWAIFSDLIYRIALALILLLIAQSIYTSNLGGAASYLTIMLSVDRLDEYMYQFFELFQKGGKLSLYADDIRLFYEMKSDIETPAAEHKQASGSAQGAKKLPANGAFAVDLEGVKFRYENSSFAIDGLSLHVAPGEKVAIVGENGVGKSTLVKLLLRLYDPQGGQIRVDGTPLAEYDMQALRRRVGVVFQDTNIYALSFRENVELYHQTTDAQLEEIVQSVQLSKMLAKNEADLNAPMTKEFDKAGMMVSVGEAQKVGLARVMTGDFGLLLLDEPSSALDPIAEYEMNQLILNRSRQTTTIVVAHRLSTVRDMDRIIVMDRGRVVESGNHDELMALRGKYYTMFTMQAENYVK